MCLADQNGLFDLAIFKLMHTKVTVFLVMFFDKSYLKSEVSIWHPLFYVLKMVAFQQNPSICGILYILGLFA